MFQLKFKWNRLTDESCVVFFCSPELIQELLCMRDNSGQVARSRCLVSSSPHGRESKTVLDSGFHAMDSGTKDRIPERLCQWKLGSGFKSLVGFQTPWAYFVPQAQISRISNFLTWGDKQLRTAKKQTATTQSNGEIRHNIVQPPNGQMSQFCIRRPLTSSPSGGV